MVDKGTITVIYFIVLSTVFCIYKGMKTKCNGNEKFSNRRNIVFIIGQARTGSTLLGDFFNQKDDVLYFFEPLRSVEVYHNISNFRLRDNSSKTLFNGKTEEFMKSILSCKYHKNQDVYLERLDYHLFRYNSKKLSSPPFCTKFKHVCKPVTSLLLNKLCLNKNLNIVVKELEFRLPNADLSFIEYISQKYGKNNRITIIHLVRDPRASFNSLKKLEWFTLNHSIYEKREDVFITERCKETIKNIDFYGVDRNIRYKFVKFEDIAMDPVQQIKAIFDSTQITFDKSTEEFVKQKTSKKDSVITDPFSTQSRDINNIKDKWKGEASKDFLEKVEHYCGDLIKRLSYKNLFLKI